MGIRKIQEYFESELEITLLQFNAALYNPISHKLIQLRIHIVA